MKRLNRINFQGGSVALRWVFDVITGLNRKFLNSNRITVKIAKNKTTATKKSKDDDKSECQQVQSQVALIKRRRPRINPAMEVGTLSVKDFT